MKYKDWYLRGVFVACVLLVSQSTANAACDCGSEEESAPCTATSLSVNVNDSGRNLRFDWEFNSDGQPARCGQFANGDYWISPAAGSNSVTVTRIDSSGGLIFADVNPQPEKMGFLREPYFRRVDRHLSVTNHDLNENIASQLPYRLSGDASIVAAIERDQSAYGGCGTRAILQGCVDAYNVVTVLDAVQPENGARILRPNVIREQKELMSLDEFNFSRLPAIDFFGAGDASRLERIRRTWSHHLEVFSMRDKQAYGYSEGGRAFRAHQLVDDYSAGVAAEWHEDLTVVFSSERSLDEKQAALAAMLTYGKDVYYQVYNDNGERERWFGVGAGQSLGRFPTAVFFAALASDPRFGNALKRASTTQVNLGGRSVHELDQVNIGVNGPVWGDGYQNLHENRNEVGRYWGEVLNRQRFNGAQFSRFGNDRGQRTLRDPYNYIDGPGGFPGSVYAGVSAGPIRAMAASMMLMPEMCEIVNYDELVTYSLRISSEGRKVDNDACAPPDPRELTGDIIRGLESEGVDTSQMQPCDTFRARNCRYYGLNHSGTPTWGPNPDDLSRCITDSPALARAQGRVDSSGTPILGRFGHLNEEARRFTIVYRVTPIENNWENIHQGRGACQKVLRAPPKPPTLFREETS